jgi:hypothetical protein
LGIAERCASDFNGVKITAAAGKPRKIGVAFGVELEGL